MWSFERFADAYQTVRCPQCSQAFVASEVRFLGVFSRRAYAALIVAFCLVSVAVAFFGGHR